MALVQLIYVSTATDRLGPDVLHDILATSVHHNADQRVTGMLLYGDGCFMQVLEGEAGAVEETMARIRRDDRHHSIILIDTAPIAAREFGDWSMGFKRIGALDAGDPHCVALDTFARRADGGSDNADSARAMLRHFARTNKG